MLGNVNFKNSSLEITKRHKKAPQTEFVGRGDSRLS